MPFDSFAVRPIGPIDEDKRVIVNVSREISLDVGGLRLSKIRFCGQVLDRYRDYQRPDRKSATLRNVSTRTEAFL